MSKECPTKLPVNGLSISKEPAVGTTIWQGCRPHDATRTLFEIARRTGPAHIRLHPAGAHGVDQHFFMCPQKRRLVACFVRN
jgi:hypothetical protein